MQFIQHPVDRTDASENYNGQKTVSAYGREFSGGSLRLYIVYRITGGEERTNFHVEPRRVQIELHIGNNSSFRVSNLSCHIRARCFRRLGAGRLMQPKQVLMRLSAVRHVGIFVIA